MIALFTDFGLGGPYLGQVEAALVRDAPGVPVVNLMADAPAHDPRRAAYLLAALIGAFPEDTVFLAVVDPGVGGPRTPGVLRAHERWFVGPDNGLFELVIRRAPEPPARWKILWRPEAISATFHGRDLFAPIAARIASGEDPGAGADFRALPVAAAGRPDWPDDLAEIVYIDGFGNAMTGLRADGIEPGSGMTVSGKSVPMAEKFSDLPEGAPFWYRNANGLAEISVNRGRADAYLNLSIGSQVAVSIM